MIPHTSAALSDHTTLLPSPLAPVDSVMGDWTLATGTKKVAPGGTVKPFVIDDPDFDPTDQCELCCPTVVRDKFRKDLVHVSMGLKLSSSLPAPKHPLQRRKHCLALTRFVIILHDECHQPWPAFALVKPWSNVGAAVALAVLTILLSRPPLACRHHGPSGLQGPLLQRETDMLSICCLFLDNCRSDNNMPDRLKRLY